MKWNGMEWNGMESRTVVYRMESRTVVYRMKWNGIPPQHYAREDIISKTT